MHQINPAIVVEKSILTTHTASSVTFRCFCTVQSQILHLDVIISCGVWIFRPYAATISSNWLVLIVHGGGTYDSSITTVFKMLLVRREKSLLILVLKSSFEHLLSECHV